jgi:hypothetical protein
MSLISAAGHAIAPSLPLGVERAGVRRGNHGARGETHLTLTLSPLKGGEEIVAYAASPCSGRLERGRFFPAMPT